MNSPVHAGRVIAGRFELVEPVGEGGAGITFKAFDRLVGEQVAVKVAAPGSAARLALTRELRVLRRLSHPGVVNTNDLLETEAGLCLSMRWVDGESLTRTVALGGPLGPRAALRLARGLAAALEAVHRAGWVHGDVKPGNVMVTPAGEPVLVDFGCARERGSAWSAADGATPGFLAPWIVEGAPTLSSLDSYGFGRTLAFSVSPRTAALCGLAGLIRHCGAAHPPEDGAVLVAMLRRTRRRRVTLSLAIAASVSALAVQINLPTPLRPGALSGAREDAASLTARGTVLAQQGSLEEAAALSSRALALDRRHGPALTLLTRCRFSLGHPAEAQALLADAASAAKPGSSEARLLLRLGTALPLLRGDFPGALAWLEVAARQPGAAPVARTLEGQVRALQGDLPGALRAWPDAPDTLRFLGAMNDEAALAGQQRPALATLARGRLLSLRGDPSAAIEPLRAAALATPREEVELWVLSQWWLARALSQTGRLGEALADYAEALRRVRVSEPGPALGVFWAPCLSEAVELAQRAGNGPLSAR